jgi:DNA-directed RNA polymerase specialized sigma24 family protein
MACRGRILVWWDREVDTSGPIRSDVRSAGRDLWEQACQRTMAAVGDTGAAAELMEGAVAQVSRYLDRVGAPMGAPKHGLVMVAFLHSLNRYRAKLSRLEFVGGSHELSECASTCSWIAQADARLELERLVRRLSARNRDVLMLRAAGFEWKEIATLFCESPAKLRNRFWREIKRLGRGPEKHM